MKKLLYTFVVALFVMGCTNSQTPMSVDFTELSTPTNASLRALFVLNEDVIWASGSSGTVVRSLDGGESWKVTQIPGAETNDFRSIHAWNADSAMVFGIAGPDFAYATGDGGASWQVVYADTTSGLFFNSLKFADPNLGLAVSDPVDGKFVVLRTEDGGKNWRQVSQMPPAEAGEANFAASNSCIEFLPTGKAWMVTGGTTARVFYSEDFGKTWQVSNTPMIRGDASAGIFSVAFKNNREGVLVGGVYDQPEINTNVAAYTVDGGQNWVTAETMTRGFRSCAQFIANGDAGFVLAVGKTGADISYDGGRNWQFLSDQGYYTFRAVPGKAMGYLAGNNGRIARVGFSKP